MKNFLFFIAIILSVHLLEIKSKQDIGTVKVDEEMIPYDQLLSDDENLNFGKFASNLKKGAEPAGKFAEEPEPITFEGVVNTEEVSTLVQNDETATSVEDYFLDEQVEDA